MNQANNELRQQIEEKQKKLDQFQREIAEKQHTQLESTEQVTALQTTIETLKDDAQQWQNKYSDLQNECQKQLTSNEQLKNTTDNVVNEKQAAIDQLTKEISTMQQVQAELTEKQIKQHADHEEQEKVLKEKLGTYEKQIQSMKSKAFSIESFPNLVRYFLGEFLLETENNKLSHEQERLRLTKALQETTNADASSTNTNVKQLEYELSEARHQIEKLKKQIQLNATQDDRSSLESQISFLNDVIVDLKNKNDQASKEIQFLKNPFGAEEGFSQTIATQIKSAAPRLYCTSFIIFSLHRCFPI